MTVTSILRLRRLLAERGRAVALVLLLLGAGGLAGGGWMYTHPPVTEITESTHVQTVHTDLTTTARATGVTPLYRQGERLHNEPVYLQRAAPVVTVALRTSVPEGTTTHVEQRLVLQTLARHEGTVFWRHNRTLVRSQTSSSGVVVSRYRLNVTSLRNHLDRYRATLGDSGSIAVRLRFVVAYDTGRYQGQFSKTVPIALESGWYEIPTASVQRIRRTTVERLATVPRGHLSYLLPAVLGGISLLGGIAALARWYQLRHLDTVELDRRIQRQTHREWISNGTIDDLDADRRVEVDSIGDLVDVGIDADRRVIYDGDRDLYAVFDGTTVYYHRPGTEEWEWHGA